MREWNTTYTVFAGILTVVTLNGCIEEFATEFTDFESSLVIDATISDELKVQKVTLSRSYEFQDEGPFMVSGANVSIRVNGRRDEFTFEEAGQGIYLSSIAFAAQPETEYELFIETQDGKKYGSNVMQLPAKVEIDSLYAKRITNDLGVDGMGIFVNATGPDSGPSFYRYEYEETFKVIAPEWDPKELDVVESNPPTVIIVPRSLDERVCYPTNMSNEIILADTDDLDKGNIRNLMVRFIPSSNYILSHRYSILVRQYSQSSETAIFLETLRELSSSESLFSESQPGFLEGNVFSETDEKEKVIGYFDVVSMDERRVFFNYEDFYPGERLPPYVDPCIYGAPEVGVIDLIRWNLIKYIEINDGIMAGGPYIIVPRVCGDCTALGTPEIPDFWIE